MATVWRTRDTVHYIQAEWSKSHDDAIDKGGLLLFLCDEHHGNLNEKRSPSPAAAATRCARPTARRCSG
ncbi:MAG: hypothetical protein V8S87_10040 [Oscillospiraceae bacterium]